MSFEPRSGEHGIVEVVFGLLLTRPFQPAEIEDLVKAHDRWRADLPRLGRMSGFQIGFRDGSFDPAMGTPVPTGGVTFDAVKRDGTLDWRLRASENNIYVNCLSYTTWSEIWPRARALILQAIEVAVKTDNSVKGAVLQYIDSFDWSGDPAAYDIDELLDTGSAFVSQGIRKKGPLWHHYQGWFRPEETLGPGRLLERINMDGTVDAKTAVPNVRLDAYLQFEADNAVSPAAYFDGKNGAPVDGAFASLHDLNKGLMRTYLTKAMCARINLDA